MTDIDTDITFDDAVTTADGKLHPTLPSLVMPRGASLNDLRVLLEAQHAAKFDTVVSASRLRYVEGTLEIRDGIEATEAQITDSGVTPAQPASDLFLAPTSIFEDQLASRLEVPQKYVRKMRGAANGDEYGQAIDLLDHNVNFWLSQQPERLFTVRGFYNEMTGDGIARAILSGRYGLYDNLDQLMAVLGGLRKVAESNPLISPETLKWKVDLTERNMRVRVIAPQIAILAPEILKGYTDPWHGRYSGSTGDNPPIIEAGIDFRNSETGAGRWLTVPFIHVQVCSNGLTRMVDAQKRTHLGGEQTEGRIRYSIDTQRKQLELLTAETADAVSQYLSEDWLAAAAADIEQAATVKVTDAKGTIEHVAAQLKFSEAERDSMFELFLRGGQDTAGGVAQAITAHAHVVSPTRAMELDDLAIPAMELAARFASR